MSGLIERVFSDNDNSVRLPFHSKSDSELPRHFWPSSKLGLGYEPALSGASTISSFVLTSRRTQTARLYSQIENGADAWCNGHHMLHGPPHGALHVLALVNNGARISQMAIQSPQHK